ncbi:MAG: response regulator, partial [Acidobacteria bacterium]|nr:response regulator [Acidobacteriota bacterium]
VIPCMYYGERISVGGMDRLLSIGVDISERRQFLEDRQTMLELWRLINSPGDMDHLVQGVSSFLEQWSGCENVSVCLAKEDDRCPECLFRHSEEGACPPDLQVVSGVRIFLCNNASQSISPSASDREMYCRSVGEGDESVALIPMHSGSSLTGVLQIRDRRPGRITPGMAALLVSIASSLAVAIEQRKMQESLRESEKQHRILLEAIPDIVIDFDRQGRLHYVSPSSRRFAEFDPAGVIGRTHRELGLSEENTALAERVLRQVVETKSPCEVELSLQLGSRQTKFNARLLPESDANGEVVSILGLFRDVTEHRQLEANYRNLFDRMLDGFAVHDMVFDEAGAAADYRFLAVNPSFELMTGLKAGDLIGRCVREVLPGLEPTWIETYSRVVRTGESIRFESFSQPLNRHFEVLAFRPAAGQFACVFRDITERKRAEKETAALQQQLVQAQKMESIGRLAGGVAHDFNNLLTVINGYSGGALAQMPAQHPWRPAMEEIHKAGERATALVRQLLAFSRKQVLRQEGLDLNEVIAEVEKTLLRLVGEDVEIVSRFQPIASVLADRHQITQVLMNLVVNARDAMPDGGTITIETRNTSREGRCNISHTEIQPGPYVQVTVRDTGCGMDQETLEQVFEPFFTTKEAGKGTGLGLATVQGIVAQSGGHVTVESTLGQGTAISFYLPAVIQKPASVPEVDHVVSLHGRESILLVEDQEEVREFSAGVLRDYGYRVLTASSAEEALGLLQAHPVDLLLTDVVMPKISGRVLADRARLMRKSLPVLFMSGYSSGLLEYPEIVLQKPFTPRELATKVREALGACALATRILVTDDEPGVRLFLRLMLESEGYEVSEAGNGQEAVRAIRDSPIDLMITDLIMPEQEGIETIRQVRREHPTIGIIALSGAGNKSYLDMTEALGADCAMAKPINPEALLEEVKRVLLRRG